MHNLEQSITDFKRKFMSPGHSREEERKERVVYEHEKRR
jgi:hypothetical protein